MTNKKPDYSSFAEYQYADLAAQLAGSEEGQRFVPGALENLVGSKGMNLGEKSLGVMKAFKTFEGNDPASQERIQQGILTYANLFQKKRGEYSPADLAGWYSPILKDLSAEASEKILNYLGRYQEPLGQINEMVGDATNTLDKKARKGKFTEEQKKEATETIKKYHDVLEVINLLDSYKRESIRPDAVSATRKRELEGLASKL